MPNKDEIKGKVEQAKGKVKQEIGKATDDQDLHDEGVADEAAGEVQQGFGTAKRKGVTRSRISAIGSSTERIDSLVCGAQQCRRPPRRCRYTASARSERASGALGIPRAGLSAVMWSPRHSSVAVLLRSSVLHLR